MDDKNKKLKEYKKKLFPKKVEEQGKELIKIEEKKGELIEIRLPKTKTEFIKNFNVQIIAEKLEKVRTVKDALMVKTPSLAKVRKTYGGKAAIAYIKIWLVDLNASLNLTRSLNEAQITEAAKLIISEFWGLTIADINIVFKNVKLGKYGELYGTLSIDKILRWFGDYQKERLDTAGEMSQEQHDKFKYLQEGNKRISEDTKEKTREAVRRYYKEQKQTEYEQNKNGENEHKG